MTIAVDLGRKATKQSNKQTTQFPLTTTTVKPVLSGDSKRRPKTVFKTDNRCMQVKSIAECSKGFILGFESQGDDF